MRVSIQGVKGSFHHIVGEQYFDKQALYIECDTFSELVETLKNKEADMAIENSISGAILPNYALIDECNLQIEGEFYLPIQHNLMAINGQKIEDIKEVISHPMAVLQCRKFFRKYPHIKLIEGTDTADIAKNISNKNIKGVAAIASTLAADIYKLNIIESSIQTIENNFTRFFILKNKEEKTLAKTNKASIKFTLNNQKGTLCKVLTVFTDNDISLTKIQSLPIIELPWEYAFFVDIIFEDYSCFEKAQKQILTYVNELKILGKYSNNR